MTSHRKIARISMLSGYCPSSYCSVCGYTTRDKIFLRYKEPTCSNYCHTDCIPEEEFCCSQVENFRKFKDIHNPVVYVDTSLELQEEGSEVLPQGLLSKDQECPLGLCCKVAAKIIHHREALHELLKSLDNLQAIVGQCKPASSDVSCSADGDTIDKDWKSHTELNSGVNNWWNSVIAKVPQTDRVQNTTFGNSNIIPLTTTEGTNPLPSNEGSLGSVNSPTPDISAPATASPLDSAHTISDTTSVSTPADTILESGSSASSASSESGVSQPEIGAVNNQGTVTSPDHLLCQSTNSRDTSVRNGRGSDRGCGRGRGGGRHLQSSRPPLTQFQRQNLRTNLQNTGGATNHSPLSQTPRLCSRCHQKGHTACEIPGAITATRKDIRRTSVGRKRNLTDRTTCLETCSQNKPAGSLNW
ncbi:mucin-21-like [Cherax quadricarinatus]|uniref:mucin-21-like n=1 Tax=Cherax quadricarinatus TaxID=27406 RepID=UPI00387EC9CF